MTAQCHILPRCLSAAQVSHDALRGVLKRAEYSPADKNNSAYSQWGKSYPRLGCFDNMSDN